MICFTTRNLLRGLLPLMAFAFLAGSTALAEPIPRSYRSTRVLGMGGAHIAIADDDATLFMNPAGLAQTRSFDLLNLELEVGLHTIETGMDIVDVVQGGSDDQLEKITGIVNDQFGNSLGFGLRFFPNLIVGGFGFGILLDIPPSASIAVPALPEIRLALPPQAGLATGYAHGFLQDSLLVGAVVKGIFRADGQVNARLNRFLALTGEGGEKCDFIVQDEVPASLCPDLQGGLAANVDAGAIYKLPPDVGRGARQWKPAFGLVIRDIPVYDVGLSTFADALNLTLSSDETPTIPMSVGVGASVSPRLGPFRTKVGLDIEDLFFATTDDTYLLKRFHLGGELQIPPFFKQRKKKEVPFLSLEAGLNQVYYTAGLNINIWRALQIGVATYGEELGPVAGDKEDRRFLFRIAL